MLFRSEREGLGLRVRLAPSVERFSDLRHGPIEQRPYEQCGDLLVRDRAGNWTYQFAVVVDDAAQGVTDVVRGADLLDSTPRQIYLQRLLGVPTPRYLHVPVAVNAAGEKLSKQTRAAPLDARHPVPALVRSAVCFADGHTRFHERACCSGSLGA